MNPFDQLVSTIETEASAIAGVAQSVSQNPGSLVPSITGAAWGITENLAGLSVGLGLFALGAIMIAASPTDDLVQLVEKGIKYIPLAAE